MENVGSNNMLNEEQESSQSNSSNGSGALQQQNSNSGGGFQLKSSILRQPATFGSGAGAGGGFGGMFGGASSIAGSSGPINSFNLKPSVLRPSHFGGGFGGSGFGGGAQRKDDDQQTNSNNSFGNPFLKTQVSEEDGSEQKKEDEEGGDREENVDPLAKLNRATLPKSNLFANVKALTQNTGFVFGQNVHERVTGENLRESDSGAVATSGLSFSSTVVATTTTTTNSNDSSSSNSAAVAASASTGSAGSGGPGAAGAAGGSKPEGGEESLEEAARRYEESRGALKRKFDEVETLTGEEDERNVVEANCKLFAFAKSNWEERGHGTVRLNDNDSKESRVVFRQAGNLRVVINTKVWSGMTAEQSSPKSLRLTAMDNNGQVKVFLLMTRPDVIGKLHKELTKRIQVAKEHATDEEALLLQDDEVGKENNNANASKPTDCEEAAPVTAADSTMTTTTVTGKEGDADEPCPKKRLSSST